jgi:hypothetical protein
MEVIESLAKRPCGLASGPNSIRVVKRTEASLCEEDRLALPVTPLAFS